MSDESKNDQHVPYKIGFDFDNNNMTHPISDVAFIFRFALYGMIHQPERCAVLCCAFKNWRKWNYLFDVKIRERNTSVCDACSSRAKDHFIFIASD